LIGHPFNNSIFHVDRAKHAGDSINRLTDRIKPMARIELRHLRTLTALRDTGSLVDAAERLCLTQSALSHQIKDLEDRLQCPLFMRKTRPVRFTGAGQRLLTLADDILPQLRAAEIDLDRLAGGETGRLYLAIECHSCFQWLMPTINTFRHHWPEVELDLSSSFSFAPLQALARGDLDLVISADPVDIPGLYYEALFRYEVRLAMSPRHALAAREYIEPRDLAREKLICYPVERARLDIFSQFLEPAGVEPESLRTAELTMMIIQLVASNRGVAALPNWAISEYEGKEFLVSRALGANGLWSTLHAAIRAEQKEHAYIRDFMGFARQTCFANLPGIVPAT
jgi:LysR family transcriptional regulator for metE and metH